MILKVVGTGSKGNCYILENDNEALVIECGVKAEFIKQALKYNVTKVVGCIITHEHGDHSKGIVDLINSGINVYATNGTFNSLKINSHRAYSILPKKIFELGKFKIMPFEVNHDAVEPVGFLIKHPETGTVLFLTDTFYSAYTFKGLNNIIIEANFSKKIIDRKVKDGATHEFLRNRILKSHLSLENCVDLLSKNDLSKVNKIILIHLSDSNSNEIEFQKEVETQTGKTVLVANNGMETEFNLTPF